MSRINKKDMPTLEQAALKMDQATLHELRKIPEHIFSVLQYEQEEEVSELLRAIERLARQKIREREVGYGTKEPQG